MLAGMKEKKKNNIVVHVYQSSWVKAKFDARTRELKASALGQPRGMG